MSYCCSMCHNHIQTIKYLVPSRCLRQNGSKAHRVCSDCWWDPVFGFAREGACHNCPGCADNLPLTLVTLCSETSPVIWCENTT